MRKECEQRTRAIGNLENQQNQNSQDRGWLTDPIEYLGTEHASINELSFKFYTRTKAMQCRWIFPKVVDYYS